MRPFYLCHMCVNPLTNANISLYCLLLATRSVNNYKNIMIKQASSRCSVPVPVAAPAQISRPSRAIGTVDAWIGVGSLNPIMLSAWTRQNNNIHRQSLYYMYSNQTRTPAYLKQHHYIFAIAYCSKQTFKSGRERFMSLKPMLPLSLAVISSLYEIFSSCKTTSMHHRA